MARRVWAFDFLTGDFLVELPVESCTWSAKHRTISAIDASFRWPLEITDHAAADLYNAIDPWRRGLAVVEEVPGTSEQYVLQAGPIFDHEAADDTGQVTVRAVSIEGYLQARLVLDESRTGNPQSWTLDLADVTLADIARKYIELMLEHDQGNPPINIPAEVGGDRVKTIAGYDMAPTWERVLNVLNRVDGPDVYFDPRVRSDRLGIEWEMLTGTEDEPIVAQSGADHFWQNTAQKPNVQGLHLARTGSNMATRVWALGQGMGVDLVVMHADSDLLAAGYPLIERIVEYNSISDRDSLYEHASAAVGAQERPYLTWTFTTRANSTPRLGRYRLGHWATLDVKRRTSAGHLKYVGMAAPSGTHRARIVEISGDLTDKVTVALAARMEDR